MEKNMEDRISPRRRFWAILPWALLAAVIILPLVTLWMVAVHSDETMVVNRNEIVREGAGGRTWHGTFTNNTRDRIYTDVVTIILFVDKDGVPVRQERGHAGRLAPGESFDLNADLPPEAVRMQLYAFRWHWNNKSFVDGPYQPWEFGGVEH